MNQLDQFTQFEAPLRIQPLLANFANSPIIINFLQDKFSENHIIINATNTIKNKELPYIPIQSHYFHLI